MSTEKVKSKMKSSTIIVLLSVLLSVAIASTIILAAFTATGKVTTNITFGNGLTLDVTANEKAFGTSDTITFSNDKTSEVSLGSILVTPNQSAFIALGIKPTVNTENDFTIIAPVIDFSKKTMTWELQKSSSKIGDMVLTYTADVTLATVEGVEGLYILYTPLAVTEENTLINSVTVTGVEGVNSLANLVISNLFTRLGGVTELDGSALDAAKVVDSNITGIVDCIPDADVKGLSFNILPSGNPVTTQSINSNSSVNISLLANTVSREVEVLQDPNDSKFTDFVVPGYVKKLGENSWEVSSAEAYADDDAVYKVTKVADNAFSEKSNVTSIILPDTITSIGEVAFGACAFNSIKLPKSLISIGGAAFSECPLKSIVLPDSIKSIGSQAFADCVYLSSIEIPESVDTIGINPFMGCIVNPFMGCIGLTNIKINEKNKNFTSRGLINNESTECNAIINKTNNTIISGCSTTIIPDTVTTIGMCAFYGCQDLNIKFSNSVTFIDSMAFIAAQITNISLPRSLQKIGDSPFADASLGNVIIPKEYETFPVCNNGPEKSGLFKDCSSIENVIFEENSKLKTIDEFVFKGCKNIKNIEFKSGSHLKSIGQFAFLRSGLQTITLPDTITSIEGGAFGNCQQLREVIISEGLKILDGAFLETPDGPLYMGSFYGCSSLESINLPSSLISISDKAFKFCTKLRTVTFANNPQIKSIGDSAFEGCTALEYYKTVNARYLGSEDNPHLVLMGVEDNTISEFQFEANTRIIGDGVFSNCDSLASITIPNSVTSIGHSAFYGCSGLTSITIPNSVTSIGYNAFDGCSGLTSITIPSSVTSIGRGAFRDCSKLSTVTFAENSQLTSIGDSAFFGCGGIKNIKIPKSVISIGSYVFSVLTGRNNALSTVIFEENSQLTSIGDSAFLHCYNLTNINIPSSVTSIGEQAFNDCSSLTSITINATTPPTLGVNAIPSNVANIYVPAASVNAYQTAPNWSNYAAKIKDIATKPAA